MGKTTDSIITDILQREGGYVNDPADKGGETEYGISRTSNPEAWADGKVTEDEARKIYLTKYVIGPGFDKIKDATLQAQLVDYGVNSGPAVAIQKLQKIVHVPVDGVLGPATLQALEAFHPDDVNNCLVAERLRMICKIVQANPTQLKFLVGWCERALEFLE